MIAVNVPQLLLLLRATCGVVGGHRKVQSRPVRNRPREGQRHRAVEREAGGEVLSLKRHGIEAVEVIPGRLDGSVEAAAVDAVHRQADFRTDADVGRGFHPNL